MLQLNIAREITLVASGGKDGPFAIKIQEHTMEFPISPVPEFEQK